MSERPIIPTLNPHPEKPASRPHIEAMTGWEEQMKSDPFWETEANGYPTPFVREIVSRVEKMILTAGKEKGMNARYQSVDFLREFEANRELRQKLHIMKSRDQWERTVSLLDNHVANGTSPYDQAFDKIAAGVFGALKESI